VGVPVTGPDTERVVEAMDCRLVLLGVDVVDPEERRGGVDIEPGARRPPRVGAPTDRRPYDFRLLGGGVIGSKTSSISEGAALTWDSRLLLPIDRCSLGGRD
jgi:hypothetical protein